MTDITNKSRQRYKSNFDRRTKERHFDPGNKIIVRDFRDSPTKIKWSAGVLICQSGSRVWTVQVEKLVWPPHENQILHCRWTSDDDSVIADPITMYFKDDNGPSTTSGPPSDPK